MQTRKEMVLLTVVLAMVIGLAGCGNDDDNVTSDKGLGPIDVDENVAISDIEEQMTNLGVDSLRMSALDWKNAIDAKVADFTELTAQIAAKSAEALLNEDIKMEVEAIKVQMDEIKNSIPALTERFNVIYEKLQSQGGNVTGLELKKII